MFYKAGSLLWKLLIKKLYTVMRVDDMCRRIEEAEAHYHGCYGVVVFDSANAVRIRSGEPVAASYGPGADRRHDPRHLRQSLFHSAGILVYLQEKGGEGMIRND